MPLTDEDRNELRDILTTARLHHWEILSVSSAMIERMLYEQPPVMNQIEVRLEALLKLYESKAEKSQCWPQPAPSCNPSWPS